MLCIHDYDDLHANMRILLHFTQFQICPQKLYQPYGPWEHFPCSLCATRRHLVLWSLTRMICICANCVHTRRLQSAPNAICLCAINAWLITRVTCQMISHSIWMSIFYCCSN